MANELEKNQSDFTQEEIDSLQDYINNNKPGLTSLKQSDIFSWVRLYMAGKTYSEIAKITKSRKDLILFVSKKQDWFGQKMEHYKDMSNSALSKYRQARMNSITKMTDMVIALNEFFGDKFDKYLSTKDEDIIKNIDSKMLAQYHKITESLDKMVEQELDPERARGNSGPILGNNSKSSAVEQKEEAIEVDVGDQNPSDILKALAEIKKNKEK